MRPVDASIRTEAGVIAEGGWGRTLRHGSKGRETARAAVRAGAFLVDPWGPSRVRRWLHVTGARLAVARPVPPTAPRTCRSEIPSLAAITLPAEVAQAEPAGPALGEMAGGGAA